MADNLITMTVTMDSAGRLVIPKELRKEAELEPGVPPEIRCRDGLIEIASKAMEVTFQHDGDERRRAAIRTRCAGGSYRGDR